MIQGSKSSFIVFTGMLAFFSLFCVVGQENDEAGSENPITVVQQFYQAIKEHRCEDVARLRPGYSKKSCSEVKEVSDIHLIPRLIGGNAKGQFAVVELQIQFRKANKEPWHGFLTVVKRKSRWQIMHDSYWSPKNIGSLETYLASPEHRRSINQPSISPVSNLPAPMPEHTTMELAVDSVTVHDPVPEDVVPEPSPAITPPQATVAPSVPSPLPPQELHHAAFPRPGATTLLDACWGPEQLRGSPGERTLHDRPADYSPPERVYPQWSNEPLEDKWARSIRFVNPAHGEKLVALTFDLCEQANERTGYDGAIVDILRAEKVNATFFAGGKWMRSHPQRAMQLMADPLFEIGNHAWTHGNLRVLRGKEMTEQIQWTQAQYELLREQLLKLPCAASVGESQIHRIPPLPTTFRFPYGACDATALKAVAEAGLYPIQWNVISGDPARRQTVDLMVKGILDKIRPGSIVIAHANGRGWHTGEALRILIPALRKQGYRFVTVSQLLKSGTPVAVESCYEVRPGDNLRYDQLFGRGTE
ncbi:MAG: polysaccharide deacetylase family protein [Candidatus Competibacter sp.]